MDALEKIRQSGLNSYAMIASLLAFSLADYFESVIRGDHYGQSNDFWRQALRWRQGDRQGSPHQERSRQGRQKEIDFWRL